MKARDHAVEVVRGTGGEQRRARGVAEYRIGLRFSCAVADVDSDIRPGPAPCDRDRCAISRRLEDHRHADAGRAVVAADGGVEFVVDAGAHDVVGDVRTGGERDRRRVHRIGDGGRDGAKIHVEVFDLAGHVAEQAGFEAGADRPARLYLQHAERGVEREGVAIGVETDARKGDRGPDRADREAAGGEAMTSGVMVLPRRPRSVPNESSFWP